jgi:uncharacterized protein YjcR
MIETDKSVPINGIGGAPKGNTNRRTHGLHSLKKAWSQLGNRMLDGRSPAP